MVILRRLLIIQTLLLYEQSIYSLILNDWGFFSLPNLEEVMTKITLLG